MTTRDTSFDSAWPEGEVRLRLALAATNQGMYDLDVKSGIASVTPEYLSMLGEDPAADAFDLRDFGNRLHPDDAERVAKMLESCIQGDADEYRGEFRIMHSSGDWVWVLSIGRVVERDADGIAVRILGSHTLITDRKEAEEALRESERWLTESQRVAGLGHYVYDMESDHWSASVALDEVLGIDEHYNHNYANYLELIHPDDRERFVDHFTREVLEERLPFDISYRVIRPSDGRERWVRGQGSVKRLDTGEPCTLFGIIQDITEHRKADTELELREARLQELLEERESNLESLGAALASIIQVVSQVVETRDPYTAGHQRRVSELAERISQEMGLSAEEIEEIRVAALLHDVGKMSVPAEILSKPGKLSNVEFELVKFHSEAGYRIIQSSSMGGRMAEIIHQHHERCDGSGYPRGLRADELLVAAKVLMVADVVEAMASHRPYRASLGMEAALAEIESGADSRYDARVAAACARVVRDQEFDFSDARATPSR